MAFSEDYQKRVLDDIRTYAGITRPVKASVLERLIVRRLPVNALHPNPEDEFCDPDIGPNEGIVSDYMTVYRQNLNKDDPPVEEKLTVQKMSTGGYMLLNGHHRWMAAIKTRLSTLPVTIVNPASEQEIIAAINRSDKQMCVSFDLDEVLLTEAGGALADHRLPFPYRFIFKRTLRKNAGLLIGELQALGFDVWVYAGSGISQEETDRLMRLHKARINGMVTLISGKKTSDTLKQAFRQKYRLSLHIDNDSLLWVNTRTKEYDSTDVAGDAAWAADVLAKVRNLEQLKAPQEDQRHA